MSGSSNYEVGGAGTLYIEQYTEDNTMSYRTRHKTLKVDNNGLSYPHAVNYDHGDLRNLLNGRYDDISESGGITWLHHFSHTYDFDEVSFKVIILYFQTHLFLCKLLHALLYMSANHDLNNI